MTITERLDNAVEQAKTNIRSILLTFGIVAVSLAYVGYSVLTLTKTELDPLKLIAKAFVGIVVGITLKVLLGEKGFIKGYNSNKWIRPCEHYEKKTEKAIPYIDKVDDFYEVERKERIAKIRKTRLQSYRMKYDFFFDENGDYKHPVIVKRHHYDKLKKKDKNYTHAENEIVLDYKQRKCLYKCIRVKCYITDIFSEYGNDLYESEKKERTDKSERERHLRSNSITAVLFAIIGVYFVPDLINFNLAEIIWSAFQVLTWITLGIINLYENYTFIIIDKVKILKQKEQLLAKFIISLLGREEYNKLYEEKEEIVEMSVEQAQQLFGQKEKNS